MADKPKQQILVPYDYTTVAKNALQCGIRMARIFNCEISIVYAVSRREAKTWTQWDHAKAEIRKKLIPVANDVISKQGINTSVYVFKGQIDHVISTFYERINAIMMVAGFNAQGKEKNAFFSLKSIINKFRELRIPILVVQDISHEGNMFQNIIMPVDFNKEAKEKSSWAGFFSKLNRSRIYLVSRTYRDPFFAAQIKNNLTSIKKLFDTAEVVFEEKNAGTIRGSIDRFALDFARANNGDMLILMATPERGIDDYFIGPPEKRIIAAARDIPVLLLNPRDDLYLPCV
ncbi:MAG: universal stress protein [Bacteroidota bacterium]